MGGDRRSGLEAGWSERGLSIVQRRENTPWEVEAVIVTDNHEGKWASSLGDDLPCPGGRGESAAKL